MNAPTPFTPALAAELTEFLAAPEQPEGTMSYPELAGFLFAICCSPEVVPTSDWLPVVWGEDGARFAETAQAQKIVPAVLSLYRYVNDGVLGEEPELPAGCEPRAEALSNLEDDAPVALWSRGFVDGNHYLEQVWDAWLAEDRGVEEDLEFVLIPLFFFSSPEIAQEIFEDNTKPGKTMAGLATDMLEVMPEAMREYADIALHLRGLAAEHEQRAAAPPRARRKVAPNAPCPCGSGRKFKSCCGRR
jgi:uncharacterized protein